MKGIVRLRWLMAASGVLLLTAECQAANGRWMNDLKEAAAEARRLDRPLLIHFYADWCGPCQKMEGETLGSPQLSALLGSQFVGLKVNTDRNRELAKQFQIESLPSDVILAPNGAVLAQTTGYQSQRDYLARLARVGAKFSDSRRVLDANTGRERPQGTEPLRPLDPPSKSAAPGESSEARFVGLNGYSPIALSERRDWVKGQKDYSATLEGVVYYFATAEELRTFESDPARYAPKLHGCDPVIYSETDRAIPGSTRFGAYFEGHLFLFVGSATREQFRKEPEKYGRITKKISVDQVEYRRGP